MKTSTIRVIIQLIGIYFLTNYLLTSFSWVWFSVDFEGFDLIRVSIAFAAYFVIFRQLIIKPDGIINFLGLNNESESDSGLISSSKLLISAVALIGFFIVVENAGQLISQTMFYIERKISNKINPLEFYGYDRRSWVYAGTSVVLGISIIIKSRAIANWIHKNTDEDGRSIELP